MNREMLRMATQFQHYDNTEIFDNKSVTSFGNWCSSKKVDFLTCKPKRKRSTNNLMIPVRQLYVLRSTLILTKYPHGQKLLVLINQFHQLPINNSSHHFLFTFFFTLVPVKGFFLYTSKRIERVRADVCYICAHLDHKDIKYDNVVRRSVFN